MGNTRAPGTGDDARPLWRAWAAWTRRPGQRTHCTRPARLRRWRGCLSGRAQHQPRCRRDLRLDDAQRRHLKAIKRYLLSHSRDLAASTGELRAQGERYYALAREANFDYARLLRERREQVDGVLTSSA